MFCFECNFYTAAFFFNALHYRFAPGPLSKGSAGSSFVCFICFLRLGNFYAAHGFVLLSFAGQTPTPHNFLLHSQPAGSSGRYCHSLLQRLPLVLGALAGRHVPFYSPAAFIQWRARFPPPLSQVDFLCFLPGASFSPVVYSKNI